MNPAMASRAWGLGGWLLLLVAAAGFHWSAMVMRPDSGDTHWIAGLHQTIGAWVYVVPLLLALPLYRGFRSVGTPTGGPVLVGTAFLLATLLWLVTFFGMLIPLTTVSVAF